LCAFWLKLAKGHWLQFEARAYGSALTMPLGNVLEYPLDIYTHPWMILVWGLLIGVLIVAPLIVAVRAGFLASVPFNLVVLLLAHAPLLAGSLVLGCLLAARTRLRSDAPFLATLLGLCPAGLYLLVSAIAMEAPLVTLPLQKWVHNVPFLTAVLAAVMISAIVLGLGRLARFQPLVVCPVWVFYDRVGRDELAFALIASQVVSGDAVFAPSSLDQWRGRPEAAGLSDRTLRIRIEQDLDVRRRDLAQRCERFLRAFPRSRRSPDVLWLRAQLASLKVSRRAFGRGQVRYSAAFLTPRSAGVWKRLVETYPAAPQAAIGKWRLGQLELRHGRVRSGYDLLRDAAKSLGAHLERRKLLGRAEWTGEVFRPARSLPAIEYYSAALFDAKRLVWLIEQNGLLEDQAAARAMAMYMQLDPDREDYAQQLEALLDDPQRRFEATSMGDNLKLAYAKATPDVFERAAMLVSLANELTDAAIEANYELGCLVISEPVLRLEAGVEQGAVYFKRVMDAPPNPYAELIAPSLARLVQPAGPVGP